MPKTFDLAFDGYFLKKDWSSLPAKSGIYCIYTCKYDKKTGEVDDLTLVYIGEADNIQTRIPEDPRERLDVWKAELAAGEVLCASYAKISPATDRERAEAALIFQHKPACNKKYKRSFPFPKTTIRAKGDHHGVATRFTVERTTRSS